MPMDDIKINKYLPYINALYRQVWLQKIFYFDKCSKNVDFSKKCIQKFKKFVLFGKLLHEFQIMIS